MSPFDSGDIPAPRQNQIDLAFSAVLLDFGGPSLADMAVCKTPESCQISGLPSVADVAGKNVYEHLEAMHRSASSEAEFQDDLARLNKKFPPNAVPMQIAGLDEKRHQVLVSATNVPEKFVVAHESGLTTLRDVDAPLKSNVSRAKNITAHINPEQIHQGMIGDCYFMSSLASVARTNPDIIRRMIKDNHNGTFSVKFPGAESTVTVDAPNSAELKLFARSNKIDWTSVVEKAHRKLTGSGVIDLGEPASASIELLTGRKSVEFDLQHSKGNANFQSTVKSELNFAMKNHLPVVAASALQPGDGIRSDHFYSVLGFDEKTGQVSLRNPTGTWLEMPEKFKHTAAGEFKMPLSKFIQDFGLMVRGT